MFLHELKTPKLGIYAGANFDESTIKSLKQYIKDNDIPNPVTNFHTTILYSRKPCPNYKPIKFDPPLKGKTTGLKKFDDNKILVVIFDSPDLVKRHNELMKEYDVTWDYPQYIPHITLSYDAKDVDINKLTPPKFGVKILKEYSEELELDWEK